MKSRPERTLTRSSSFEIMCGYDLYDANPNTRTVQRSLNACILDCHNTLGRKCIGVTWVESGQADQ